MKVGDRVRVNTSVVVYHNPELKKEPFDLQGSEGEIIKIIGEPITANLPILVEFTSKFRAHLRENELEVVG